MSRKITRRTFLKAVRNTALVSVAGAGSLYYGLEVEPFNYQVVRRELTLPRLDPAFDGYTITQLTDLHVDLATTTRAHLQEVVRLANAQKSDLVVFTGDYLTIFSDDVAQILIDELPKLKSSEPLLGVWGNHDWWAGHAPVVQTLRETGVNILENDVYTIERDGQYLHIGGVDDWWEKYSDIEAVIAKLPAEGSAILLAHEPDFADITAETGRFDLQVSGHSHGGQVRIPGIGAPILPTYGEKYPAGLYKINDLQQYTSRGIGMVQPAVRYNCRPEIAVFTLRVKDI